MQKTMYDYIQEQPAALTALLQNRQGNSRVFANAFKTHAPDRLYLIASGSSCNAAKAAAPFMEEVLGIETTVAAPTQLPVIRGERPFLVFISQGGNSNNTLSAIESLQGYPSIVLIGDAASRMGKLYPHVLIGCGEETAGPKTKGYTCTVLALYLMALTASEDAGADTSGYCAALEAAIGNMAENIRRAEAWLDTNAEGLQSISKIFLAAHGNGLAIAEEGALKILETMLVPAQGFEFEEYLHGPICALEEKLAGLYLLPTSGSEDLRRAQILTEFHRSLSPLVYTVGGGLGGNDTRDCDMLTTGAWYTGVFEWIPVPQMMGAKLPAPMGVDGRGHEVYTALSGKLNVKFEGGA